jgi:hypothetical protein
MRRVVGYLFLAGMGGAAALALADRSRRGSMVDPAGGGGPDWFGIVLVACALGGGVWILTKGKKNDGN